MQETRKSVRSDISNFGTEKRRREREIQQGASLILHYLSSGIRAEDILCLFMVASCHMMAADRDVVVADRNRRSIWEFQIGDDFSMNSFQLKRPMLLALLPILSKQVRW